MMQSLKQQIIQYQKILQKNPRRLIDRIFRPYSETIDLFVRIASDLHQSPSIYALFPPFACNNERVFVTPYIYIHLLKESTIRY
ncbi:unnamed protein product [Onchocerca ochengi]|uniref:5-formyltetrahydrofolate cyclo-ligase n=1 Tax=Onchocerca ochengi TaxID=42157 RepID=A0A182EC51_ONCOC|nr:unnamed protein product [Onchocerca ochengi]